MMTNAELIADLIVKANYWEPTARTIPPDAAAHCLDYAAHLRTMAEMLRQDELEAAVNASGS